MLLGEGAGVTDTGIDERVGHVDSKVHDHEGNRKQRYARLEDKEVTPEDRVDGELAHTGQREQLLGDHDAADECPDIHRGRGINENVDGRKACRNRIRELGGPWPAP